MSKGHEAALPKKLAKLRSSPSSNRLAQRKTEILVRHEREPANEVACGMEGAQKSACARIA
jgi:hypothetical protein